MTPDMLLDEAERPMERLRWLVLKEFEILPFSKEGLAVSDGEILKMAAHMVLDRQEGTEMSVNPYFVAEKFSEVQSRGE